MIESKKELGEIVTHFASALFPSATGVLSSIAPSGNLLETIVEWGEDPPTRDIFPPAECWALRTGRVHKTEPGAKLGRRHVGPHHHGTTALCILLMAQGKALGLLHLQIMAADERLALAFADTIGLAVANLEPQQTLRTQAIRDPLTHLFNRRYMEESFSRETLRAERKGTR